MAGLSELFFSFNNVSIVARLVLAAFCGGLIGIERETNPFLMPFNEPYED